MKIEKARKNKKPIGLLINAFGMGGGERTLAALLPSLSENFDIHLIFLAKERPFYAIPKNVKVVYFSNWIKNPIIKGLFLPIYAFLLARYARKHKLIIVQSHLYRANFVNILSKKLFFSPHKIQIVNGGTISRFQEGGPENFINGKLVKCLYPFGGLLILKSMGMAQEIKPLLPKLSLKVVYNPQNIADLRRKALKKINLPLEEKDFLLITVGRLIGLKRTKDIILALDKLGLADEKGEAWDKTGLADEKGGAWDKSGLADEKCGTCDKTELADEKIGPLKKSGRCHEKSGAIKLLVVGDGPEKEKLKELSVRLGLEKRVLFLGQKNNPYPFMNRAKIMILSSETEGCPNALLEAMALGCAVISSDCKFGPREILDNSADYEKLERGKFYKAKYGLLYPPKDVNALSLALKYFMDNPSVRERYSQRARKRAADFDIKAISQKYREILCSAK